MNEPDHEGYLTALMQAKAAPLEPDKTIKL